MRISSLLPSYMSYTVFLLVFLVFSGGFSAYGISPGNGRDHQICLKNRRFTPDAAGKRSGLYGHVIVQFDSAIDRSDISQLTARGIKVVGPVPRNALMVNIPEGVDLGDVARIRWSGKMRPADKISRHLQKSLKKGYFLVDAFADIDAGASVSLIKSCGGTVIENPYLLKGTFLVTADRRAVEKLSNSDGISWLWPASDAIISGQPVHRCIGAPSEEGVIANYVTYGDGWDGDGLGSVELGYHFENGTTDISGSLEETEVVRAFYIWSDYVQIFWHEESNSGEDRTIDVKWVTGDHGDSKPFDGASGVLAHCFYPPPNSEPVAGDLHFDDDELWKIGSHIDLFSVALHESGHGIGIGHSDNTDAVMYAYYAIVDDLHQDDIDAAQSLYASVPPDCEITVTSPSSGDTVNTTVPFVIKWHSMSNVANDVSIDLYAEDAFYSTIATGTPDDGEFAWPGGSDLDAACSWQIKIASSSDPCCYDFSDFFCVDSYSIEIIYSADMQDDPGWQLQGQWQWGIPLGLGSHNEDPSSGYTGENVIGYNLGGDYPNYMSTPSYATLGPVDCSGAYDVILKFYRWLGVESSSYDHAEIDISNDGVNWVNIWENPDFATSDSSWDYLEYPLDPGVVDDQPQVYIRWGLGDTDGSLTYPGWNIDDVILEGKITSDPNSGPIADLNDDHSVDTLDLQIFAVHWLEGSCVDVPPCGGADLTGDNKVDMDDLSVFAGLWMKLD